MPSNGRIEVMLHLTVVAGRDASQTLILPKLSDPGATGPTATKVLEAPSVSTTCTPSPTLQPINKALANQPPYIGATVVKEGTTDSPVQEPGIATGFDSAAARSTPPAFPTSQRVGPDSTSRASSQTRYQKLLQEKGRAQSPWGALSTAPSPVQPGLPMSAHAEVTLRAVQSNKYFAQIAQWEPSGSRPGTRTTSPAVRSATPATGYPSPASGSVSLPLQTTAAGTGSLEEHWDEPSAQLQRALRPRGRRGQPNA
ncbi:hypothetical protein BDV93DRAFT_564545 [Ceratobasidium sp. AG-I]|nr:hypothetical protein BDV93DRAFT_564545 [Ceratobasidium sp. AG-I]